MKSRIFRALCAIVVALLTGCATNVRFAGDQLPSGKITGEQACEVPQHWKALALQGVDTRSLTKATVVQVRIPPEWIGDALGWYVESDLDEKTMVHYPRLSWQALVVDRHGKQHVFPAAMRNPLDPAQSQGVPVLTVLIPNGVIPAGEEVTVYVPSGAYTKLLTTGGDLLRLPVGKDCLGLVNAEFVRSFPSRATVLLAGESLLASIRVDFPTPSLQDDGLVYSHNLMGLNPQVVGNLRQVNREERIGERGAYGSPLDPVGTAIGAGIAIIATSEDKYVGPFGERLYSSGEALAALGNYLKGYNTLKEKLERTLGIPSIGNAVIHLDYSGRKSGWVIGEMIAPQVTVLWETLDQLKARYLRIKEKGGVTAMKKEVTQTGLLPSSPPLTSTRSPP